MYKFGAKSGDFGAKVGSFIKIKLETVKQAAKHCTFSVFTVGDVVKIVKIKFPKIAKMLGRRLGSEWMTIVKSTAVSPSSSRPSILTRL